MTDDGTNTIIETTLDDEQLIATKRSLLAMPLEEEELAPPSITEIQDFIKAQNEDEDNQEKKTNGERVANYYFGRLQLKEMQDYLQKRFPETWQDKFMIVENFVKSVSSQLSTVYKKSPKRDPEPLRGQTVTDKTLEEQDDLIDFVYKRGGIDKSFQEIERFAKWSRSVLIRAQWQPENKKIRLKPYSPQFWDVMISDSGVLRAVVISDWVPKNGETQDKANRRYWVWTKEFNGLRFEGEAADLVDNTDEKLSEKVNEMEIIPFVLFNDELPVENEKPYLHPDILMQNTNLAINKMLTDGESLIEFQIYGMPYMIGGDPDNLPDQTGAQVFQHFPRGTMDETNPEIGILQPVADFDGLLKFIERVANGYGTSRGLAPDSFSAMKSNAPQSGISLKLQNHVVIEMRDSEETKYDELENEVFPIVREIHNFQKGRDNGHDLEEMSDQVKLGLDFAETDEAFENEAENQRQSLTEVSQGLLKRSDFVRRRFPRKSGDEAVTYLEEVKEENKKLGVMNSLEDLDNALNGDEGGPDGSE